MGIERTLEETLVAFLEGKKAINESIQTEIAFGKKGEGFYRSDIYLPQGCKKLNIPARTIIEVKRRLQPDTLYNLHRLFINNEHHWNINSFFVIYADQNLFSEELLSAFKAYEAEHFYVFSVVEFTRCEVLVNVGKPTKEDWKHKRARIIQDAQSDFEQGHNTLFLGAGLGPGVNMPTWDQLLSDLFNKAQANSHSSIGSADYSDIDQACNHSSLIIGRYIESGFNNMNEFKTQMYSSIYQNNPRPSSELYSAIVKAIATEKVTQVITFNYDDLVETALMDHNIEVHSVFDRSHYSGSAFPVYHVHGMIPQTRQIDSTPVLSEKEYHTLYKESFHWSNVVQLQALSSTTCFFIGLSMNDPNLRRLLDISRHGMGELNQDAMTERACHYAILERKPLNRAKTDPAKNAEHFAIQERLMNDLGISIIWYDQGKFDDIPSILRQIIS